MSTIRKITTVNSKGQVTLPKAVRRLLDIGTGEKVVFDLRGKEVVISKLEQAEPPHRTSLNSYPSA